MGTMRPNKYDVSIKLGIYFKKIYGIAYKLIINNLFNIDKC